MLRTRQILKSGARFTAFLGAGRPMPWQMDSLLDIGSREIFTDDHDKEREKFRAFWQSGVVFNLSLLLIG